MNDYQRQETEGTSTTLPRAKNRTAASRRRPKFRLDSTATAQRATHGSQPRNGYRRKGFSNKPTCWINFRIPESQKCTLQPEKNS